jgi:hypothetical protein
MSWIFISCLDFSISHHSKSGHPKFGHRSVWFYLILIGLLWLKKKLKRKLKNDLLPFNSIRNPVFLSSVFLCGHLYIYPITFLLTVYFNVPTTFALSFHLFCNFSVRRIKTFIFCCFLKHLLFRINFPAVFRGRHTKIFLKTVSKILM